VSDFYYDIDGNWTTLEGWVQGQKDKWQLKTERGDVLVSTVHLGIDHGLGENSPPIIFETMVFGGELSDAQWRYCTKEQTIEGHGVLSAAAFGTKVWGVDGVVRDAILELTKNDAY